MPHYLIHTFARVLCTLIFFSHQCVAEQTQPQPEEAVFAIGFSLEPYMFKNGNGIIAELIRGSLNISGKSVRFKLFSNLKAIEHFSNGQSDGVAVVTQGMTKAWLSQPFVKFQNYAISLQRNNIHLSQLGDLKDHDVVAFSNARKFLGAQFATITPTMNSYTEIEQQIDQVKALFHGKTDIVIADKTIFEFYMARLRNRFPLDKKYRQPFTFHKLFPPSNYHAAFHNKQLRDEFDRGFTQLKASGQTDKIYQTYSRLLETF